MWTGHVTDMQIYRTEGTIYDCPIDEAFGKSLGLVVKQLGKTDSGIRRIFGGERLIVVDVGSGRMRYSEALLSWLYKKNALPSLFGTDPRRTGDINERVTYLPERIEDIGHLLASHGIDRIDLLTMFNPNPEHPLPNPLALGSLATQTPLIVSCPDDWGRHFDQYEVDRITAGLINNGYKPITLHHNPYWSSLKRLGYSFNPFIVSIPNI